MAFKAVLICASSLLVQTITAQCFKKAAIATDGFGLGLAGAGMAGVGIAGAGLAHAGAGLAHADAASMSVAANGIGFADHRLGWHGDYGLGLRAGHEFGWHGDYGLGLRAGHELGWHGDDRLGWHGDHRLDFHAGRDVMIDNRVGLDLAIPTSGGALPITTTSPISPSGLSVISENEIEGALAVTGKLPFLSAVAVDGALPTGGSGAVQCGCGDGHIGIDHFIGDNFGYAHDFGLGHEAGLGYGAARYGLDAADLHLGRAGLGLDATRIGLGAGAGLARTRAFY